jgi:predicted deacylase
MPGTSARLVWSPDESFEGIAVPTAVLVVNGVRDGPTLCLTAALHGDELNGIEIVRRVLYELDPQQLSGTVVGVPIVNLHGFRRNSRYLPDRRDLNRFFPGAPHGSSASRIAHSFFQQVVRRCNALVDIHTGSFQRTNLPQLRADMKVPAVASLTSGFTATSVLHSQGEPGTLRRAAVEAGIPAVTLETGEPGRLQESKIDHGTQGIAGLIDHLGMVPRARARAAPEPVYYESTWVRADRGGLLFGSVRLGQRVRTGELLGTVTDPITNVRSELRAPQDGRVLGMAQNQVVMPGFAAFRIGIPTTESDLANPAAPAPAEGAPLPAPADSPAGAPAPPPDEENS